MNKIQPKGYGYYTPTKVKNVVSSGAYCRGTDGLWYPAVPEPYYSFFERLRYAWHVLTYKADALYWVDEKEFAIDRNKNN